MIVDLVLKDFVRFLKMVRIRCNLRVEDVKVHIEVFKFSNERRILSMELYFRKCVMPRGASLFIDKKLWLPWPWKVRVFDCRKSKKWQGESWDV